MYNFFTELPEVDGVFRLCGNDFNHAKNVLRLKIGERFLVSHGGKSSLCELTSYEEQTVIAKIIERDFQDTSLPIEIYLFQGLPKSDKLELIIQKAVELGAHSIIPVEMKRSIVKIEEKKKDSKTARWQAIAESASKQSKRSIIPTVNKPVSFSSAIQMAKDLDLIIVPYESKDGMSDTISALRLVKSGMKIGVFIGPEGGFEQDEIDKTIEVGGKIISLGKRILRTETASIATVAMIMLYAECVL